MYQPVMKLQISSSAAFSLYGLEFGIAVAKTRNLIEYPIQKHTG